MLSFWERRTIPAVINYCKRNFQQWEMNYFFEQLRSEIRAAEQKKALNSYLILCDDQVRSDLPNEKFDWNSLLSEECIVGKWVRVRLEFNSKYHIYSIPQYMKENQINEVIGIVRVVDFESNTALIEYHDA